MKHWVKGTFTDAEGAPSFKRQVVFILVLTTIFGIFKKVDQTYIDTLSLLIGFILGATSAEKFTKK